VKSLYFQLTESVKRRFIEELRRYWAYHPKYRDDLVQNIQGKFSFEERPQHGIIIKTGSGNRVDLSADNYIGLIHSYCLLTRVGTKPGLSVEWVREDSIAIQNNGGNFPSSPGIYYLDIVNATAEEAASGACAAAGDLVFYVDPLLEVFHEPVMLLDPTHAQLQRPPARYLRLFEMPSGFGLVEDVNYTLDKDATGENPTGGITLTTPLTGGRWLQADYRYQAESSGPYPIHEMHGNNVAVPGVVIAFGRRAEAGDQVAVVVHDIRRPAYMEYGGKWELSLDCDVMSRDVHSQQEIVDQTVMYLWGVLRSHLSHQGIEITDVTMGGESEDIYDENGDDYFYNANFTITCQTDWSIHVPIDGWVRMAAPLTHAQHAEIAGLSDDELKDQDGNIKLLEALGVQPVQDPFWSGKQGTFEMVK
jgi:hypothetical protein